MDDLKDIVGNIVQELTLLRRWMKVPKRPQVKLDFNGMSFVEVLELPDNLRKTVLAVSELGEAAAEDVAGTRGRIRKVESRYLNVLVRMDHLEKRRNGRNAYFKVEYKRWALHSWRGY